MKFLSTFIIVLLLVWTWKEVYAPASVTLDTHIDLQEDIQRIIREKIIELAPAAKDVVFHKIWTRALTENEVEAFFEYSFSATDVSQAAAKMKLSGRAHLTRGSDAIEGAWTFDKLEIDGQEIEFEDDTVIRPGDDASETTSPQ